MASWGKVAGGRRPPPSPNGGKVSGGVARSYRRAPYPLREDRGEEAEDGEGFEQQYDEGNTEEDYSTETDYEGYEQTAPEPKRYHPGEKRHAIYRWFYKVLEGCAAKKPADCVVLAVNTQTPDYAKSLALSLQERGLSVEMLCLQSEAGLTRALQDIRSDGCPLCILIEQTNVTLSSCTVIVFSESLKIHRNMPREQALDFVLVEFGRVRGHAALAALAHSTRQEPAEVSSRAAELTDDFLAREKLERHPVPEDTRHLLLLLAEGAHLYPEEVDTLTHFLHERQEHLEASSASGEGEPQRRGLPPGMGPPPPLLPTPAVPGAPTRDRPGPPPPSGTYPKSKPPPLLSMDSTPPMPPHRPPGPHGPPPRGPMRGHPPRGPMGHRGPRGPPPQNGPPHGPRAPPPSLIAHHPPGLLPLPGPPPRPPMPRH
ncbi:nuclear receptor coactivator 5 isoform X2 [Engraulis encrasicolus]|uniref:nuclear receptor coactivator 5 isoform X2 n=1 Tax=Engraulis encrasicolus TaxID=184585 RepID=UPI002FCFB8A0